MNCPNCGAPMRLILEKRQYVCNHCTTSYFPEENKDNIRVFGGQVLGGQVLGGQVLGGRSQGACPICRVHYLVFATIADKTILHCNGCRGILLQIRELLPIIQALRAQRPADAEMIPPPLDRSELARKVNCPVCKSTMDTYQYGGGGNVYVDSCIACGVIWLDYLEMNRIVEAPTRQKREPYKTLWEQQGISRSGNQDDYWGDNADLWGAASVLTSNISRILDRIF